MAVEIEIKIKEALAKLPENHPDRASLEKALLNVKVERFTLETIGDLEGRGYRIYRLTGQSIRSLREERKPFWSTWHNSTSFEEPVSRISEVAINQRQLTLPGSNWKTLKEQREMVAEFSEQLSRRIPGIEAVIGEAQEYAELYFSHMEQTGESLFGKKGNFQVRTNTFANGVCVTHMGDVPSKKEVFFGSFVRDGVGQTIFAAPIIVPKSATV